MRFIIGLLAICFVAAIKLFCIFTVKVMRWLTWLEVNDIQLVAEHPYVPIEKEYGQMGLFGKWMLHKIKKMKECKL